jgi:undecaprenyl-diphosphatase
VRSDRIDLAALMVATIAALCFAWLAAKVVDGQTTLFDANVRQAIHSMSGPSVTRLFSAITFAGSQAVVIGISACSALLMLSKRRGDWALLMVITMAGAEVLLPILKNHFDRQRPEPFFGARLPPSYSFPSGHALLSCCYYGLLAAFGSTSLRHRIRWLIPILAVALIIALGVSRIYLGLHYPTDVIAGYLAAIVWMALIAAIYRRRIAM